MRSPLLVLGLFTLAAPLAAQHRAGDLRGVPAEYYPPPNTCRIWFDGARPERQSAPVDCATAERTAPPNARIIYGVTARSPQGAFGLPGELPQDRGRSEGGIDRRTPDCSSPFDRNRADCDTSGVNRGSSNGSIANGCVDADRDGVCDDLEAAGRPAPTLPQMGGAVLYSKLGRRTSEITTWLGAGPLAVRYIDSDGDGMPEMAEWRDARRQIVQVWIDDDRDGRADRVLLYRDGRVVRVIR